MRIKFVGTTLQKYKGLDGKGGILSMERSDVAEVSEDVAKLLLQHYGANFEIVAQAPRAAHAPRGDKQLKKQAQFKSK